MTTHLEWQWVQDMTHYAEAHGHRYSVRYSPDLEWTLMIDDVFHSRSSSLVAAKRRAAVHAERKTDRRPEAIFTFPHEDWYYDKRGCWECEFNYLVVNIKEQTVSVLPRFSLMHDRTAAILGGEILPFAPLLSKRGVFENTQDLSFVEKLRPDIWQILQQWRRTT